MIKLLFDLGLALASRFGGTSLDNVGVTLPHPMFLALLNEFGDGRFQEHFGPACAPYFRIALNGQVSITVFSNKHYVVQERVDN